jgi:hypothetical protein
MSGASRSCRQRGGDHEEESSSGATREMDASFVRDVFVGFSGLYAGWLHVCVPIGVPVIHAASA